MKRAILSILILLLFSSFSFAKDDSIITVCTRVVDGDTIVISGGDKVRLIGIDTPEVYENAKLHKDSKRTGQDIKIIQALGKQASDYAKKILEGKQIKLEYDPNNQYIHHKDKYGRLLAYVYLPDGTFFNAQIIKDGHAYAYIKFPSS